MRAARFTPNGKRVIGADRDGAIRVWDLPSGQLAHTLTFPKGGQYSRELWVSGDSRLLVSPAYYNAYAHSWDLMTGKHLAKFSLDTSWRFIEQLSNTGDRLVAVQPGRHKGQAHLRVVNPRTGKLRCSFAASTLYFGTTVLDGDRRFAATIFARHNLSMDDVVVWNTDTGEEVLSVGHDAGGVPRLHFSEDGSRLHVDGLQRSLTFSVPGGKVLRDEPATQTALPWGALPVTRNVPMARNPLPPAVERALLVGGESVDDRDIVTVTNGAELDVAKVMVRRRRPDQSFWHLPEPWLAAGLLALLLGSLWRDWRRRLAAPAPSP
jgi:hypothetical protein